MRQWLKAHSSVSGLTNFDLWIGTHLTAALLTILVVGIPLVTLALLFGWKWFP